MLAQLHANGNLRFNSAFHLERFPNESGNPRRISNQILTWGNGIKQAKSRIHEPNGLFLGLDSHRNWIIDTAKLPSSQELRELGITRMVYLTEYDPAVNFSYKYIKRQSPLQYYANLEKEGIEVFYKGADTRPNSKKDISTEEYPILPSDFYTNLYKNRK